MPRNFLLLPAAAKCAVKLHETLILCAAGLREHEFRGKERPLPIQDFEIRSGTSSVAHDRQTHGLLQVRHGLLLANPDLMVFLVTNQRIGYVPERVLNRLPVRNQGLLMLRFGQPQIPA